MNVCILTQYYPPEIGAPQARLSELATYFKENDHDVTVLTSIPNYPTGKIFSGYGRFFKTETLNNIKVIMSYIYPSISLKMIPRLWNYFSFVISSIIVGIFKLPKCDILITESPPLFLGISGYVLSKIKRAKWIFNVSDLWPESAVHLGIVKKSVSLDLAFTLERFCYNKAWLITGQSREIVNDINKRFPNIKTYHLSNGVNVELFSPMNRSDMLRNKLKFGNKCVAIYAGLHGMAQGLEQVLKAAAQLQIVPDLLFIFVGDGPEKERLMRISDELQLNNVRFLNPYSRDEMPALLASADIALVPLKKSLPGAVPSKLYEAMSVGLALLLIAEGEAEQIVLKAQAGIVTKPGDTQGLIDALHKLSSDSLLRHQFGNHARNAVELCFNRHRINSDFVKYLEEKI
jgi:glycosyltransferase involved in cell wall biosynthesis